MRFALRTALLALAVFAATSAPASGASTATTIHLPKGTRGLAGPVFAGDAVAFGRPAGDVYEVVMGRGPNVAISRVALPRTGAYRRFISAQLEASDRRVALGLRERVCQTRKHCGAPGKAKLVYAAALTRGLGGGKLTRLAGCTDAAACAQRPGCSAGDVDVSGDVVAFSDCAGRVHTRNRAPGANPSGRVYPAPSSSVRLADPFLAYRGSGGTVLVTNWRTGADAYSVLSWHDLYDVQSDGKLAYEPNSHQLAWASPLEPFAHVVREEPGPLGSIRITSDRLGYAWGSNAPSGQVIEEHNLDTPPPHEEDRGILAEFFDTHALPSLDFDGSRFTWITRVCRRSWVTVWDLQDEQPPYLPRVSCPIPRLVHGSARVDAKKRFRVTLECPPDPPVGCVGWVTAYEYPDPVDVRYSIPAGERATKQLSSGGLCRSQDGAVRTRILFALERGYSGQSTPVTVRGPTGGFPPC